jgi:hypothetical protein
MNRNLYLIAAMLFIVISLPAAVHAKIGTPVYRTPAGPGQTTKPTPAAARFQSPVPSDTHIRTSWSATAARS